MGNGRASHRLSTIVAATTLCFVLAACGGGPNSSGTETTGATAGESSSASGTESAGASSSGTGTQADEHNSYFVGKWNLYETEDATHEQVVQVMEVYATDEQKHQEMDEAYGRTDWEFCARFEADGTGTVDTGMEVVPFTWEATNEGAVTFTSFDGKETALHLPVTDGKFTLNGDTYAKAS